MTHPFHGVHIVGEAATSHLERMQAFAPLLGAARLYSHVSAAVAWDLPVPLMLLDGPIDVSAPAPANAPRGRGVRGHAITAPQRAIARGLPVTGPVQTWIHLAGVLDRRDLVAVGDRIVSGDRLPGGSRSRPLARIEEMIAAASRHRGRGSASLIWALPRIRTSVDSRMETRLRLLIVEHGLPEPETGLEIAAGGRILHPDLGYRALRILFEFEGDVHRVDRATWKRDLARREDVEAAEYRYIRVTSDDVFVYPRHFIARLERIISQQSTRLLRYGE